MDPDPKQPPNSGDARQIWTSAQAWVSAQKCIMQNQLTAQRPGPQAGKQQHHNSQILGLGKVSQQKEEAI